MAQFGEGYWQSRSEALIRDMDPEFYYRQDPEEYLELGEREGFKKLTRNLLAQQKMQDLYWDDEPGDREQVTQMWLDRDESFPDWFWRYHGVYA
jgi:hypothetical protein